ncbi:MAG TPA: glycosyltransferase [Candidatus Acidoferrum sp.]|jgi:glycosyltransferase involved in cell wall biosynthesis|nr:glycosyltransferase [Candidatus Acidoferrum sp.]
MTSPTRLLLVCSITPKPTGFGEVTLYRHLCGEPRLEVQVVPHPGNSRFFRLVRRTALRPWVDGLEVLGEGRRWDTEAHRLARSFQPQVLLTIAAGDGCHGALRLARETRLPLVTIFHDWWPDIVPAWVRTGEEARFRALYRGSAVALCVSEGMRGALGPHSDSRLLWPIPGKTESALGGGCTETCSEKRFFKVCYSGNLREYAPMLQRALEVMKEHPSIRLEVRGLNPRWPAAFRKEMLARGLYHEFAPREELERWLASADAFLITSAFEPSMRRMMQTNFPSKLIDYARFGKPMIVWGPEYSTLIQWAHPGRRAVCVTAPASQALCVALEHLSASPVEQRRLAAESLRAAWVEFDPAAIQEQFIQALRDASQRAEPREACRGSFAPRTSALVNETLQRLKAES